MGLKMHTFRCLCIYAYIYSSLQHQAVKKKRIEDKTRNMKYTKKFKGAFETKNLQQFTVQDMVIEFGNHHVHVTEKLEPISPVAIYDRIFIRILLQICLTLATICATSSLSPKHMIHFPCYCILVLKL